MVANGTTYTASDKLYAVPEITTISQRNDAGLTGNDIELKFNFQDNSTEENYYLEQYQLPFRPFPLYGVLNDEFTNGNNMFSLIFDEDFEVDFLKNNWILKTKNGEKNIFPFPKNLIGLHQIENAALAIFSLLSQNLKLVNKNRIEAALLTANWPTRLQKIKSGKFYNLKPNQHIPYHKIQQKYMIMNHIYI